MHPAVLDEYDEYGYPKELIFHCGCSNENCPSLGRSILIRTDNPVPLSFLDSLVDHFIKSLEKRT
jgi:hypothetical protein